jgi:diguanylate cyclase (GGDEF)-like protein/PAS domain S-box-containing protein
MDKDLYSGENDFLKEFDEMCDQLNTLDKLEIKMRVMERGYADYGLKPQAADMLDSVPQSESTDLESGFGQSIGNALRDLLLKFKREAAYYLSILENQNELICRFHNDGTITFVNRAYCRYFKKTHKEIIGKSFRPFIPEEDMRSVDSTLDSITPESPTVVYEHRFLVPEEKDIDVRWLKWIGTGVLFNVSGNTLEIQTVGNDVTAQKLMEISLVERESQLERLAKHDPLTDLPNRLYFNSRLQEEILRSNRFKHSLAVMFLDIDDFKKINDSLGHDTGDILLKEVAQRIGESLRNTDIVSRLGGDEFTILLPELNLIEGAGIAAGKIIESVSKPYYIKDFELYVTISIGIAIYPDDGQDADTIVKNADTAMYDVKSKDKNSYQYYDSMMNKVTMERITLETDLRKAVENREFILYYQPQISMKTGQIVGLEALIRWNHPVKGMVPPIKFIPLSEQTGLIIPISEWVIKTACKQNKLWQENGFPKISIAVNISTKHFKQPNLIALITEALRDTKLEPECLELEITESMVMHNVESVIDILQKFRDAGLPISVDDFGTGYSSLNYLKRLPVTKLKIDQSFVRNITSDKNDAMIVKTIIEMAHNLNLKVIAEGVETSEHAEFLRKLDCDELQGYFFSKPLPAAELAELWTVLGIIN